ncbi:MAG: 5-oxoprolinase subunit PxpB [Hydrotalea sp.]|jgi:inhibitor of KinA|nr:5-oxoprolinase subunit PxpB [Hydrotalea sp.]
MVQIVPPDTFSFAAEEFLLMEWRSTNDELVKRSIQSHFHWIQEQSFPWVRDCIPSRHRLGIQMNLLVFQSLCKHTNIAQYWEDLFQDADIVYKHQVSKTHIIPVCYDVSLAPDIEEVARISGVELDYIIQLHTSVEYEVSMMGFLPGFAYMDGLPAPIHVPRLSKPRTEVPAGSVAIAGTSTAIYPVASPGGWRIIGRTPLSMLSDDIESPTRFNVGDRVRFTPIGLREWNNLMHE